MNDVLRRLRARGTVVIKADDRGFDVSWWPPGQHGNTFAGRGDHGYDLDAILVTLEADTRPPWYPDVESVRYARERHAERERQERQRFALRCVDLHDRRRERKSRMALEYQTKREAQQRRRERQRVRDNLMGWGA